MNFKRDLIKPIFPFRYRLFICLFLSFITLVVYWQVRGHKFINFDDTNYVTENDQVRNGLSLLNVRWALTAVVGANWHPLTLMSHMIDYEIYGNCPGCHHVTNLIFHVLNSLMLFLIFHRMTADVWKSCFVSALFVLHPLHVESVAWISERKDVLSTFFGFLTIISYIRYCERPGAVRFIPVWLMYVLGLMSKPMVVTLPFVLLLLDFWPLERLKISAGKDDHQIFHSVMLMKPLLLEKLPLFLFSMLVCVITLVAQGSHSAVASFDAFPFQTRIANAFISYVKYCVKSVWPFDLSVLYPYQSIFMPLEALSSFILIAAISFVVFRFARQKPYLAVGWLWYMGMLVPVIGLVQVGAQAMADRYTYVPLVGISMIMAWGIPDIVAKWKHKAFGMRAMAAVFLLLLSGITWRQIAYWKDGKTLFSRALDVTEKNFIAHNNLGAALFEEGNLDEASRHFLESIKISPSFAFSYNNLGTYFENQGKDAEAVLYYQKAIQLSPDYTDAYTNLGYVFIKIGNTDKGIEYNKKALQIDPDNAVADYNIGIALEKQNRLNEAIKHFSEAIRKNPYYAKAYNNLGALLVRANKMDNVEYYFEKAIQLDPAYSDAKQNLKAVREFKSSINKGLY